MGKKKMAILSHSAGERCNAIFARCARLNVADVVLLSQQLPELAMLEQHESSFTRKVFEAPFLTGRLPRAALGDYAWVISESVSIFMKGEPPARWLLPVALLYLWCVVHQDSSAEIADYFLFKIIDGEHKNDADIHAVFEFLQSLENDLALQPELRKKPVYAPLCLALTFLEARLKGNVGLEMRQKLEALLRETGGSVLPTQDYYACAWDEYYRYDESWFGLIEKYEMPLTDSAVLILTDLIL